MTNTQKKQNMAKISAILASLYPDAQCSLEFGGDAWRLLVMGRLSAQCTDERVNIVCRELFSRFPTPADMAAAELSEIEELVRPCGLFHTKAQNIKDCSRMLIEEYDGVLPDDMDTLLLFPGVGRKIANLLLGDIFHRGGVVTDTHCIRICGRLGFYPESEKNPYKIEKLLTPLLPQEQASDFCHRIVYFGRDICTARSPRCNECEIGKCGLCEHLLQIQRSSQKKAKKDAQKSAPKESDTQKATPKTAEAPNDKKAAHTSSGDKSAKIKIDVPIIVEGKYDKITLSSIADANIIQTDGFAVFNKKEKLSLIRRLGERHGVILLTDSDGGGRQIRSYLLSALPKDKVINLYIPQVVGKEKRKKTASRAGFLGVEGTDAEVLRRLLTPYAVGGEKKTSSDPVTKNDFYFDGLSGTDGSAERRKRLACALSLPEDMSANALLQAVNLLISREEYKRIISEL